MKYLARLEPLLRRCFDHKCALEAEAWRAGRGTVKLEQIESSITFDRIDNSRVCMMLKKEVNIVPLDTRALPKKARGIQYCTNLRTAYELASEQTSFCHALAEATQAELYYGRIKCCVRYTAEMSPYDIAAFATESEVRRSGYVTSFIDERDGKNWDANVQVAHRMAMVGFYAKLSVKLANMAAAQVRVKGKYTGQGVRVSYEVNGTVKSGHWDTSSGNGALNIEITMQAIAMLGDDGPVEVRGLVMGDDLLLWLYFDREVDPQWYADAISAAERRLGIEPVRGIFGDILNASFCSMGFYWAREGLAVMPKVGRCLAKLFWTVTPLAGRDPKRLASTIAHAFYPTYHSYMPMRQYLRHHMKVPPLEVAVTDVMPYVLRGDVMPRYEGVKWAEAHLVKYGIPPDALHDMPDVLARGESGVVSHPVVNIMIAQDTSDPPERRGVLAF